MPGLVFSGLVALKKAMDYRLINIAFAPGNYGWADHTTHGKSHYSDSEN
jgi:hypothetical protein